ncbi:hypothetical protein AB0I49_15730 [Streptomyces sp. NPDC050617]|uniref:hypothetical protein n=1 Tax=Streptomyces sp. NPDC050617 TaxID=3154628 RepID=UPI00341CDBAF
MVFDTEWAQAKVRAAQQSSAARTRLNGTTTGDGGGQEDLIVAQDDLGVVGHSAHRLHGGLTAAGSHAKTASEDAGTELTGSHFTAGAALTKLSSTWDTQVKTLLEACAHISNHLDYSSKAYGAEDQKIATTMRDAQKKAMTPSRIAEYYS